MNKQMMRMALCLCALAAAFGCSALAASGAATPGYTTAREDCTVTYEESTETYTAACAGLNDGRYALLVVKTQAEVPETGPVDYAISDSTIAYIGQTNSVNGAVSFTFPVAQKTHCVVLLGGPGMTEPKILGSLVKLGAIVQGTVTSYAPGVPVQLELYAQGTTSAPLYQTKTTAETGTGEKEQSFAFDGVEAGTYDLKVSKPGHTSYWLTGIPVAKDVTLAKKMTLRCGNVNDDGKVNVDGLVTLTKAANYNQPVTAAADPLCDLNGDGFINLTDLLILTDPANYNKGSVTEIYSAP